MFRKIKNFIPLAVISMFFVISCKSPSNNLQEDNDFPFLTTDNIYDLTWGDLGSEGYDERNCRGDEFFLNFLVNFNGKPYSGPVFDLYDDEKLVGYYKDGYPDTDSIWTQDRGSGEYRDYTYFQDVNGKIKVREYIDYHKYSKTYGHGVRISDILLVDTTFREMMGTIYSIVGYDQLGEIQSQEVYSKDGDLTWLFIRDSLEINYENKLEGCTFKISNLSKGVVVYLMDRKPELAVVIDEYEYPMIRKEYFPKDQNGNYHGNNAFVWYDQFGVKDVLYFDIKAIEAKYKIDY